MNSKRISISRFLLTQHSLQQAHHASQLHAFGCNDTKARFSANHCRRLVVIAGRLRQVARPIVTVYITEGAGENAGKLHARVAVARQGGNGSTLILGLDGSPSDLDPHSQYDYRSTTVVRSIYEGLVGLKGSATDEYEGLVAESWEANDDQSVWTFKIRPGLTFQDGSPCDSAAVKASFERRIAMNLGAQAVFTRFISDPAQMTTPDPGTIVFDCGAPQPLFVTALSST